MGFWKQRILQLRPLGVSIFAPRAKISEILYPRTTRWDLPGIVIFSRLYQNLVWKFSLGIIII